MAEQASLTMLGKEFGEHPAWVRHHLKQLEDVGLVELSETRIQSGVVEKFYRACAGGFLLQQVILPENPSRPSIVFSGSHDLAIELLAARLAPHLDLLTMPVGSLDGLVALRQNIAQISGCHLLDSSGEYNVPFVNRFFPDRPVKIITLAHREQGLMTAPGNPKSIFTVADLARPDLTFINRNPGSGTRLWFDQQLTALAIPTTRINGYATAVPTHTECARLVQLGTANAAIGLQAAARLCGLNFIPLFHERYDLVFHDGMSASLTPLLDTIQTAIFRRGVNALTGYETTHTGEQIPL
jgi:putative molybdopterin biosynthesis protein